ncbi:hypothetical protein, partial [Paenibacillus pini]
EQSSTVSSGSWTVPTALPVGKALQVRVKVKDEHAWSEWSTLGWVKLEGESGKLLLASNEYYSLMAKKDG